MPDFTPGVVITVAAGRWDNLKRCLSCLDADETPVVVVFDGEDAWPSDEQRDALDEAGVYVVAAPRFTPGGEQEQPRNLGEAYLPDVCTHAWFLDSDLFLDADAVLDAYRLALRRGPDRVLIGPYDWLAPGQTSSSGQLEQRDPRWPSFDEHAPDEVLTRDLGAALACFGGNLVWPREAFRAIGGFSQEINHGRCEDGELGLRACEAGIPMSFVRGALASHVWHPRNLEWILAANRRDVLLINQWHPWVEDGGLVPVNEDGCRFDFVCSTCGVQLNTWHLWEHYASHR